MQTPGHQALKLTSYFFARDTSYMFAGMPFSVHRFDPGQWAIGEIMPRGKLSGGRGAPGGDQADGSSPGWPAIRG
jgi:hypothetical protein